MAHTTFSKAYSADASAQIDVGRYAYPVYAADAYRHLVLRIDEARRNGSDSPLVRKDFGLTVEKVMFIAHGYSLTLRGVPLIQERWMVDPMQPYGPTVRYAIPAALLHGQIEEIRSREDLGRTISCTASTSLLDRTLERMMRYEPFQLSAVSRGDAWERSYEAGERFVSDEATLKQFKKYARNNVLSAQKAENLDDRENIVEP